MFKILYKKNRYSQRKVEMLRKEVTIYRRTGVCAQSLPSLSDPPGAEGGWEGWQGALSAEVLFSLERQKRNKVTNAR